MSVNFAARCLAALERLGHSLVAEGSNVFRLEKRYFVSPDECCLFGLTLHLLFITDLFQSVVHRLKMHAQIDFNLEL